MRTWDVTITYQTQSTVKRLSFMAFGSNDVHWRFSEEQWAKGRHLEKIFDSASGLSLKKVKSTQKDSLSRNKCVVCAFHLCRGNVSVVLVCSHQLHPWNLIHEEHIFSIPRFNRHLSFVPEEWVVSTSLCIVKWSRGSGGQTHRRRSWRELERGSGEKCARLRRAYCVKQHIPVSLMRSWDVTITYQTQSTVKRLSL